MRSPRAKMGARYGRRGEERRFIFVKRKGNCFGLCARSFRIGDEYVRGREGVEDYGEIDEEFQRNGRDVSLFLFPWEGE